MLRSSLLHSFPLCRPSQERLQRVNRTSIALRETLSKPPVLGPTDFAERSRVAREREGGRAVSTSPRVRVRHAWNRDSSRCNEKKFRSYSIDENRAVRKEFFSACERYFLLSWICSFRGLFGFFSVDKRLIVVCNPIKSPLPHSGSRCTYLLCGESPGRGVAWRGVASAPPRSRPPAARQRRGRGCSQILVEGG